METTFQDILKFATTYLTQFMVAIFFIGITVRVLIYWTIKREDWFTGEFNRRVHYFLEEIDQGSNFSFYIVTKQLLEKSFYELFMMRAIMKRRKSDIIISISDRIFLTQQGAAFIVKNTLKQIKYLKHSSSHTPKMLEIAKFVCQNNPCFGKLFGFIPLTVNDIINVLPGIFVIGGIFGTFLGIMDGLHSLTSIDIADVEGTQDVMNRFLTHVAFSMTTSIVGIILSVTMTIINTIFSPEKLFINIVERYENTLDIMWNRSHNNELPENIKNFDENRDPAEALAEMAVNKEHKNSKFNKYEKVEVEGQHLINHNIDKINKNKRAS